MNKKLINGLLLLAVATSGASVFTSCKDNEDATLADVYNNQKRLADRLQEKDADLAARLAKLEDAGYLTQADRTYLLGLIEKNSNSIEAVKTYLDAKIASLVTSIEVQRVYNNMFGTLNLPFGINSTVLANYYYQASNAVTFPNFDDPSKDEYNGTNPDIIDGVRAWELGIKPEAISMPANKPVFDDPTSDEGSLGKIYVTVNPSNIPAEGLPVTLVTSSKDEKKAVTTTLELKEADDIEFTFGGGTRGTSSNGLYVIDVPFKAEDIENIKVSLDEGLKQAVKDFYHDQNKTNLAAIAKG
ncbi:MAG: hypothetical protein K2H15_05350, partial [Muribaculaceae bacterium]|nr:hypothetical protein [Muribaculaceae bacterium]